MNDFFKPIVGWSACLGIRSCRYDAGTKPNPLGKIFFSKVQLLDFCPEEEAGLGTPRLPMNLYFIKPNSWALMEPTSGTDFTQALNRAAEKIIARLALAEGLLLKAKSPSCAIFDCKGYDLQSSTGSWNPVAGLFGQKIIDHPGRWLYLDERQLADPWRRELWLTGLFQLARLRATKDFSQFHQSQQAISQGLGIKEALGERSQDPAAYRDLWVRTLNHPPSWETFTRRLGLPQLAFEPADLRLLAGPGLYPDQSLQAPYPHELRTGA
ncbi:MAG: DUF523 domain-containing protein [bacterium]|nr:DUF523 domain-containing protein [bacterium]